MLLVKTVQHLHNLLRTVRKEHQQVGFVPTMGALHQGHLSLIEAAARESQYVVCSIFVNPSQFNDRNDLERYPRTPERDIEMLSQTPCDLLFMPAVPEIYPPGWESDAPTAFGFMDQTMDAVHRPGHFEGVAKVVKRLLDIVEPAILYLGQKDFQQYTIIREMTRQLQLPVKVQRCPTLREADGLAMSSRNASLAQDQRRKAPAIYEALRQAQQQLACVPPRQIEADALETLRQAGLEPEYFQIVNGHTLKLCDDPLKHDFIVACVAARLGTVRLIDNLILKEEKTEKTS